MNAREHHLVAYVARCIGLQGWMPAIYSGAAFVACESLLERMYLLALLHEAEANHLEATSGRYGLPAMVPGEGASILLLDAWLSFADQVGPGTMRIRPQVDHGACTRDFVLEYDEEPALIVEVDGYAVHRARRTADVVRDLAAPLPTLRLYEETCPPLAWPARILSADWSAPCNHCGLAIQGEHSCPPI